MRLFTFFFTSCIFKGGCIFWDRIEGFGAIFSYRTTRLLSTRESVDSFYPEESTTHATPNCNSPAFERYYSAGVHFRVDVSRLGDDAVI